MADTTQQDIDAAVDYASRNYMLTTVDNPFDPFTQFTEWYAFDVDKGYHTSSYLARVVQTSDQLSEVDQAVAVQRAIDEIVRENITGMYRKVSRSA